MTYNILNYRVNSNDRAKETLQVTYNNIYNAFDDAD